MLLSLYLVLNEIEHAVDAPPDDLDPFPDDAITPNADGPQSSPRGGGTSSDPLGELSRENPSPVRGAQ